MKFVKSVVDALSVKLKQHRIIQFFEFAAAMAVIWPLSRLPRRVAFHLGEMLGLAMYWLLKRRRDLGVRNLTVAFGETLTEQEKRAILKTTFRNLGKSLVEMLHFPRMSNAYFAEHVQMIGLEHYAAAKAKGRGVLCMSGHIGNWEMSGQALSAAGNLCSVVVRPLNNPYLNRLLERLRMLRGNRLLARGQNGLKQILTTLKANDMVVILMDQNTRRSKGIFVDFFGKPACTIPVIALVALRYHVPVIPGFIVRTGFDTHEVRFGAEIEMERTGDTQKDIEINTAKLNRILEDIIRQYPDQWLWGHHRWKTQPE